MQTTALLKKEAPKSAVSNVRKFTNPLQRKAIVEQEDALQMKQNPLQLQTGLEEEEDKPLQMKQAPVQLVDGLDDEEEEPLQMKQDPLQRVENEDEELLQKKGKPLQLKKEGYNPLQFKPVTSTSLQPKAEDTAAQQPKRNNTGLPNNLKAGVEALSGYSLDDVKVHYNSDKPAQLQALAYAQGTDIHVAPGQEQHLPHEAWHVVQQKQGRVQPTMQMKQGVAVNNNKVLENEADRMGAQALQMKSKEDAVFIDRQSNKVGSVGVVQKKLQDIVNNGTLLKQSTFSQGQGIVQRILYHVKGAPFSVGEAEAWNSLAEIAHEFPGNDDFILGVESNIYETDSRVTIAGELPELRRRIRTGILTRILNRNDATNLNWGEFAPMLTDMATRYGGLTGPVATGGHAAQTYTYTYDGESVSIAEETNAHGQTPGNLSTRRGQMRNAIDLYNSAVNADANRYQ